jgi:HlyD family secretion protein
MMTSGRTTAVTLAALIVFGGAVALAANPAGAPDTARGSGHEKTWQAVAPGLIEPRSGEIHLMAPLIGRIADVPVQAGDKVVAGELLVRLDDEEARARVASAQANFATRKRARNDQGAGKAADRRKAEDAVAEAEAAVFEARDAFDRAANAKRTGGGSDDEITSARAAWTSAQDRLTQQRAQLRKVEALSDTPLPTQVEGALNAARTELRVAFAELENLSIRAPAASTVLQNNAKLGELAAPTSTRPLVLLGDLSALRVRAELDERDVGAIKVGDNVVVRTDAFRDREFAGKVAAIAPIVQPGRINAPGSRNLSDFSVAEVLIDLADSGPLVVGMKVDVYFQPEKAAQ